MLTVLKLHHLSETIYLKGRYNDFDRMIHLIRPVVII